MNLDTDYPVVLVHGYYATTATNEPIRRLLRSKGYQTYNVPLPGLNFQDMRRSSHTVGRRVDEVLRKTGADKVLMVGVSMGGLIGLHYIRRNGGAGKVRRFVALGSPFRGTPMAPIGRLISGFQASAAKQIHADSKFIKELHAHPYPDADIVSIGAKGDPLVPESCVHVDDAKVIISAHARWPGGHYYLVLDPRNHHLLLEQLPERGE